jgi:succinyl-CoA synthetase beta subunit
MLTHGVFYCVYLTGGYDMTAIDSDGKMWMLVDGDGNPVSKGDAITDFRGEACTLDSAEIPRHAASTGRVNNFFPSVFGLKWVVV